MPRSRVWLWGSRPGGHPGKLVAPPPCWVLPSTAQGSSKMPGEQQLPTWAHSLLPAVLKSRKLCKASVFNNSFADSTWPDLKPLDTLELKHVHLSSCTSSAFLQSVTRGGVGGLSWRFWEYGGGAHSILKVDSKFRSLAGPRVWGKSLETT